MARCSYRSPPFAMNPTWRSSATWTSPVERRRATQTFCQGAGNLFFLCGVNANPSMRLASFFKRARRFRGYFPCPFTASPPSIWAMLSNLPPSRKGRSGQIPKSAYRRFPPLVADALSDPCPARPGPARPSTGRYRPAMCGSAGQPRAASDRTQLLHHRLALLQEPGQQPATSNLPSHPLIEVAGLQTRMSHEICLRHARRHLL